MEPTTWIISGVAFAAVAAARFLFASSPHTRMQVRVCEHLGFQAVSKYEDQLLAAAPHVLEGRLQGHTVRLCWSFWLLVPRRSRSFLQSVAAASAGANAVPPPRVCVVVDGLPSGVQLVALVRGVADMLRGRLGPLLTRALKSGDAALDQALLMWGEPMPALAALDVTARVLIREAAAVGGAGLVIEGGKLYVFAPHPPPSPQAAEALVSGAVALAAHLSAAWGDDPIEAGCALLASDPVPAVRVRWVRVLASEGGLRGQDAVRAALRDVHPSVRLEAGVALRDQEALAALACDPAVSDAIRGDAFAWLVRSADEGVTRAALVAALLTGEGRLLVEALRYISGDGASARVEDRDLLLPVIARMSAQPAADEVALVALCGALSKLRHPDAQALFIAWLEHPSRAVQAAAMEGLGEVGDVQAISAIRLRAQQGERRFALWHDANQAIERIRARHPDDAQAGLLALSAPDSGAGALSLAKGKPERSS
jgi:HEAT repeat protein